MMQMCIIHLCIMNPFSFGKVVTQSDFCERPGLVKQLRTGLESGQNCVLLGERRTGKTSLIHESVRRLRSFRLLYAQFWAVKSIDDVAARLLRGITSMQARKSWLERIGSTLSHLRPVIEFDPMSGQPNVTIAPGTKLTPSGLDAVFDLIGEISQSRRIVVALDEFQDIQDVPDASAVLGAMRARIQQQSQASYVFAGSIRHEMEKIFRDPSSPFFKSLQCIEVGAIRREAFQKHLDKKFRSGRRIVSQEAFDMIFELADDNPSDVQQLCSAVWATTAFKNEVWTSEIQTALQRIMATERKGYEVLLNPLTSNQQKVLKALATEGGARPQSKAFMAATGISLPASVKRALTRLVNLQIIYGPASNYKFFDPFLKQWIMREL